MAYMLQHIQVAFSSLALYNKIQIIMLDFIPWISFCHIPLAYHLTHDNKLKNDSILLNTEGD